MKAGTWRAARCRHEGEERGGESKKVEGRIEGTGTEAEVSPVALFTSKFASVLFFLFRN